MNTDLAVVLALLVGSMVLFIRNKPRMDVVALLVIVALPLSGVLTIQEAVAGFSDPSVLLIAALFVIGDGLVRTGIAYKLGDWMARQAGSSETRLIVLLMLTVAGLGSVMSSTGVVAIFIPVVMSVAVRTKIAPSRLMMPLSFAGLISGMLTLVATPPNLVVHSELVRNGLDGFSFFSFTPIGLVILLLSIGYMLVARRWLGRGATDRKEPERQSMQDLAALYRLPERERRLRLNDNSPLIGRPLNELELRSEYGINVIAVERQRRFRNLLQVATGNTVPQPDDILLVDLASPAIALLMKSVLPRCRWRTPTTACIPISWGWPRWRCRRSRDWPARPFRKWPSAAVTDSMWWGCGATVRPCPACWSTRNCGPAIPCWWPAAGRTSTACTC